MPTLESTIEYMEMLNRKPVARFRWVDLAADRFEVQGDLGNETGIKRCLPVAGFSTAAEAIRLQRALNDRFGFR